MSKPRKIVVDGVEYTWRCGRGGIKVRRDDTVIFAMSIEEFKDCTPDDLERAEWKHYGDGSVRSIWPSEVAAKIKEYEAASKR